MVLAADNCTDRTVEIALSPRGSKAFETIDNTHKKSGALNQGWERTKADTDLYITIDADTILPPNAIADWAAELADPKVAGVSAKFTMMTPAEVRNLAETGTVPTARRANGARCFATWVPGALPGCCWRSSSSPGWTDTALRREIGWTSALAETACAIRAAAGGSRRARGVGSRDRGRTSQRSRTFT